MKIEIRDSILKDIKKISKKEKQKLLTIYDIFTNAQNLTDIQGIKKLKGYENFYRYRIRDYRLGFVVEDNKVIFLRYLHRKDIYKYFP